MKESIRIHILPTYKVDEDTTFTRYDSTDKSVGDLVGYDKLLNSLFKQYSIDQVLIGGGDISKLSDMYFDLLYKVVKLYVDNVSVYTKFVTFNEALINGADIINIEYNFDADSKFKKQIFSNIKAAVQIGKIINLKTIDLACTSEPTKLINTLNKLNIKTWEIIPYQATEYSNKEYISSYKRFEEKVLEFLDYSYQMNFAFYNKLQIEGILNTNNYNTKLVYLTPHTKFALQEYKNGIMYLKEYDTIDDLSEGLNTIKQQQAIYCKDCNIKLKCLANYYQDFQRLSESCCGFSTLISKGNSKKENK